MFKSAATKIAHNSTLPSLAVGNKDLRPLQDVITAEKSVLISLQRLSVDLSKASEALRAWGMGEGDDLTDILSASTNLLNQFSTALSNYASHEHAIREHMKAIRTREEALDDMKRRRKALISKADTAEKKLSKMSPEHKNLSVQTDALNRLRDDIRVIDSEIMTEEAALSDFKRAKAKAWMGLKFGGLLECCEKGTIVGEFGRLIINEIPEDTTQPGLPRLMYTNQPKVDSLVTDAMRCINEVTFSTTPAPGSSGPAQDRGPVQGSSNYLSTPQDIGNGHFLDPSIISTQSPPMPQPDLPSWNTDDFGTASPSQYEAPSSGRFATFPVKTQSSNGGYSLRDDSMLDRHGQGDDSFSSSVAAALNGRRSNDDPAPSYEPFPEIHVPPPGPPPGAAPPVMLESPWEDKSFIGPTADYPSDKRYSDEGTSLAYMTNGDDDDDASKPMGHARQPSEKQVRFGQVVDVDTELAKKQQQQQVGEFPSSSVGTSSDAKKRIPPPTLSPEEEERALNAAVAREVSRELDSLNFNPPPKIDTATEFGRERGGSFGSSAAANINREPSPLLPPQPPFTYRGPSPHPEDPVPLRSPYPEDDAEQQPPTSPTHGSSPRSPVLSNRAASPPQMSIPERTPSSVSTSTLGGGTPYRTPPEYPRSVGTSSFGQRSTTSLSGGISAPAPGGARTISAAAFRRPSPRVPSTGSTDMGSGLSMGRGLADTSPLTLKKRLPNSPYPQRSEVPSSMPSSPLMHEAPSTAFTGRERADSRGSSTIPPPPPPNDSYHQGAGGHEPGMDDHYDYLSAYTDPPGTGSPQRTDFGTLGNIKVVNDYGMMSPGTPNTAPPPAGAAGGYSEGKFATNLESELR